MLKVSIEKIVPVTEARSRLSELIEEAVDDNFWVLTKSGRPRVALVDVSYLDKLVRKARFNDLAAQSQSTFDSHLRRHGFDPDRISAEEAENILLSS